MVLAALVALRTPNVAVSATPEWVCTVSHLAAGLLPLSLALWLLRGS